MKNKQKEWHTATKPLKNYIDTKVKCCHLKKFTCEGDFAAGVYLTEAPSPPMTPYLLTYTLYTCILYTSSHREGERGGRANQREG
jgi:hypothetical protein